MRIPVNPQVSTKDGVSAKNARLTNCLKESKKGGDKAVVRPGLVLDAQASGVGNGLVVFNNELVSVYGATLGLNTVAGSGGWSLSESGAAAIAGGFDATTALVGGVGVFASVAGVNDFYYRINADLSIDELTATFTDFSGTGEAVTCNDSNGLWVYWFETNVVYYFFTDGVTPIEGTVTIDIQGMDVVSALFASCVPVSGDLVLAIRLNDGLDDYDYYYTSSNGISFSLGGIVPGAYPSDQKVLLGSTLYAYSSGDTTPPQTITVSSSADGFTWASQSVVGFQSALVTAFSQGGTIYLGFGDDWTSGQTRINKIYSSTDGVNFSLEWDDVLPTAKAYPLLFGDGTNLYVIDTTSGDVYINAAGEATIPALATITGDFYDFAQSPL